MNISVLNTSLEVVNVIDAYKSMIWTDRYYEVGEFELVTEVSYEILSNIGMDYILQIGESEHSMLVNKILIKTDSDNGNYLTISGESLESILKRRILWGLISISGNLQNGIKTLINSSIISPSDEKRKISNFVFEDSTDPAITGLTIEAQYTGDNLYDVIQKICSDKNIGFKVTLSDDLKFVFKLYSGTDRSYNQIANPYVIFSPKFENLLNSNYIQSVVSMKTISLIGGEGEGSARKYAVTGSDETGLSRREIFTDARDISSDVSDGTKLSDSDYTAQLIQRGNEDLAACVSVSSFEGKVDTSVMFKYGTDFQNGDIVQIENEYGQVGASRVLEVVISQDEDGLSIYPTFSS